MHNVCPSHAVLNEIRSICFREYTEEAAKELEYVTLNSLDYSTKQSNSDQYMCKDRYNNEAIGLGYIDYNSFELIMLEILEKHQFTIPPKARKVKKGKKVKPVKVTPYTPGAKTYMVYKDSPITLHAVFNYIWVETGSNIDSDGNRYVEAVECKKLLTNTHPSLNESFDAISFNKFELDEFIQASSDLTTGHIQEQYFLELFMRKCQ